MPCYAPKVAAWYKPEFAQSRPGGLGKPLFLGDFRGLDVDYTETINLPDWITDKLQLYQLPCGRCEGCRIANMQQWQFRAMCELKLHSVNAFITLTVDDSNMPIVFPSMKLQHRFFQLFMKKLRKMLSPQKVRYIMCGEYGTHTFRPHYHCIVFGWFPGDYSLFSHSDKYDTFVSKTLADLWPYGFHTVSQANEQTVRYLVGYVMKKASYDYPKDAPPYLRVSTRPAIGLDFFNKYGGEIFNQSSDLQFPNSFVYSGNSKIAVPRYFCKKFQSRADNVDYVSFQNYRRSRLKALPMLDLCDLQLREEWFKQVTQASHKNFRENEV